LYFVERVGCRRQFTFAISSPDELLFIIIKKMHCLFDVGLRGDDL